jgi:hypothetical protein
MEIDLISEWKGYLWKNEREEDQEQYRARGYGRQ